MDDGARRDTLSRPDTLSRRDTLSRIVLELTRESRARVRSRTDVEALLVRGRPVRHRLHAVVVLGLALLALPVAATLGPGPAALALAAAAGYGLLWLFLAVTGGEELERIAVDEAGHVERTRLGRRRETRGEVLRVAAPAIVLAACCYAGFGLVRDIAYPPPPNCTTSATGSDACLAVPDPVTGQRRGSFTVDQTRTIERGVRVLELAVVLVLGAGAGLFLRQMLSGHDVFFVEAVRKRSR